ncbi:hypothetical protein ACI2KR_31140 [Pseudomonas luteola]
MKLQMYAEIMLLGLLGTIGEIVGVALWQHNNLTAPTQSIGVHGAAILGFVAGIMGALVLLEIIDHIMKLKSKSEWY